MLALFITTQRETAPLVVLVDMCSLRSLIEHVGNEVEVKMGPALEAV